MIAVRVREEVLDYLRKLPPEPRHAFAVGDQGSGR